MALPRKHIPLETRLRVVLTQLGEMFPDRLMASAIQARLVGATLEHRLERLADLLNCARSELRLDHNPALGLRRKIKNRDGVIVAYDPPEHDPQFLIYRSHADHLIKTHTRGDGAQRSDTAQMKYLRKVEKNKKKRKMLAEGKRPKGYQPIQQSKKPWPKRKFPTGNSPTFRTKDSSAY